MKARKYIFGLFIFLSLALAQPAFGHASLIKTYPVGNAKIGSLPDKISLDFDEELIDLGSGYRLSVIDPNGDEITTGDVVINVANISRSMKPSTVAGNYKVSYRVVSNDGHVVEGEFGFTLANRETPSPAGSTNEPAPNASASTNVSFSSKGQTNPENNVTTQVSQSVHSEHKENFFSHHRSHITWTVIAIIVVVAFFYYRRTIE